MNEMDMRKLVGYEIATGVAFTFLLVITSALLLIDGILIQVPPILTKILIGATVALLIIYMKLAYDRMKREIELLERTRSGTPSQRAKLITTAMKLYPHIAGLSKKEASTGVITSEHIIEALKMLSLPEIYQICFDESDPSRLGDVLMRYEKVTRDVADRDLPEAIVSLLTHTVVLLKTTDRFVEEMKKQANPPVGG